MGRHRIGSSMFNSIDINAFVYYFIVILIYLQCAFLNSHDIINHNPQILIPPSVSAVSDSIYVLTARISALIELIGVGLFVIEAFASPGHNAFLIRTPHC